MCIRDRGGSKAKYQMNINAIKLLKQLGAEQRLATSEEQKILSQYVGWGSLSDAFDESKETVSYTHLLVKIIVCLLMIWS